MNRYDIKFGGWLMYFGLLAFGFGICTVVARFILQGELSELGKYVTLFGGAIMVVVGSALIVEGVQTMIVGAHASEAAALEEPESFLERLLGGRQTLEH